MVVCIYIYENQKITMSIQDRFKTWEKEQEVRENTIRI